MYKHKNLSLNKNLLLAAKNGINNTINYGIQTIKDIELVSQNKSGGAILSFRDDLWMSPGHALAYFLDNCEAQFLTPNSVAGRIAILTLRDGVESPYTQYSAESLIKPRVGNIRSIILKFTLVKGDLGRVGKLPSFAAADDRRNLDSDDSKRNIALMSWQVFSNEVKRQALIACQTANDDPNGQYEMATPYVLYTSRGDRHPEHPTPLEQRRQYGLNLMRPRKEDVDAAEHKLAELLINQGKVHWPDFVNLAYNGIKDNKNYNRRLNVGVAAMTFINTIEAIRMPQPQILSLTLDDRGVIRTGIDLDRDVSVRNIQIYMVPVIYELIRVAVWSNFLHLDLHQGNYFVVPAERRATDDPIFTTRALLIDWGTVLPLFESGKARDEEEQARVVAEAEALKELWKSDDSMGILLDKIEEKLTNKTVRKNSRIATLKTIQKALYGGATGSALEPQNPALKQQFIGFLNNYHSLCKRTSAANQRAVAEVWQALDVTPPNLLNAEAYFKEEYKRLATDLGTIALHTVDPSTSSDGDTGTGIGGRKKKTKKSFRGSNTTREKHWSRKTRKSRGKKRHRKQRKTRRA